MYQGLELSDEAVHAYMYTQVALYLYLLFTRGLSGILSCMYNNT